MAWGNQTWGYLRWGELGDVFVNVENPNNVPWGGNARRIITMQARFREMDELCWAILWLYLI